MAMQTFSGKQYLQIDVANNFGLDKEDWDVRLDWFKTNESRLEHLLKEAEEPALFYASVQAYRKAAAGHLIRYPISLDATASGLQISSCLTGCMTSARLCNVVDTGHREDAYTNVYEAMQAALDEEAAIIDMDTSGQVIHKVRNKIDRKDVKKAVEQ